VAYRSWKAEPYWNLIFHEFVEKEQNDIISEYRIDPAVLVRKASPLLVGDRALTPGSAISAAIRLWEGQLLLIEEEARREMNTAKFHGTKGMTRIPRRRNVFFFP
jgi:hypothetical protein